MFTQVEFLTSAAKVEQFPELDLGEIAVVGRSNVGKSSLINHLTNHKKLSFVSSVPGKTQLINFFNVDNEFVFVDLPGYGFTKTGQSKREQWGELIQSYLENREHLKCVLFLLDIRHPPSKDDIAFYQWAKHYNKPLFVIFTKADKIKKGAIDASCKKHLAHLGSSALEYISYSIKDAKGRKTLMHKLKEFIWER